MAEAPTLFAKRKLSGASEPPTANKRKFSLSDFTFEELGAHVSQLRQARPNLELWTQFTNHDLKGEKLGKTFRVWCQEANPDLTDFFDFEATIEDSNFIIDDIKENEVNEPANLVLLGDSILDDNRTIELFNQHMPTKNYSIRGSVTQNVPNQIAQSIDSIDENTIVVISIGGNNIARHLVTLGPHLMQVAPELMAGFGFMMPNQPRPHGGNMDGRFTIIETTLAGAFADVRREIANLIASIPSNRIILLTFPIPQLLQTMIIPTFQRMQTQGQITNNPFTRQKISKMIRNVYEGHVTGGGAPVELVHLSSELTPNMFRDMLHPNDEGREMIVDLVTAKLIENDWC